MEKPRDEITIIDHGGGLGFIGLLAKEAGVGVVIYNDIDPKFMQAASAIGDVVRAKADRYVVGDIDVLIGALTSTMTRVDALVSYDVLEHIYDLDGFFEQLCNSICCPGLIFSSSGANMFSPRYVRMVLRIQKGRELLNQCKRINIINECAPHLSEEEVVLLCRKTRLLVRKEIEAVVRHYLHTIEVQLPRLWGANAYDPYRSNTVDPNTGWWAEQGVSRTWGKYFGGNLMKLEIVRDIS